MFSPVLTRMLEISVECKSKVIKGPQAYNIHLSVQSKTSGCLLYN